MSEIETAAQSQVAPIAPPQVVMPEELRGSVPMRTRAREDASVPTATPQPQLKQVFFGGDANTPDTYQAEIKWAGQNAEIDLLTDSEYDAYFAEELRIGQLLENIRDADDPNAALEEITNARRALYGGIVQDKVKGLGKQKISLERLSDILPSEKRKLCRLIVQMSRMDEVAEAFLETA